MITLKNKTNEQRNYDKGIYHLSNLDRDFFSLLNLNITSVEKEIDTISINVDNVDILRDEKYKTLVLKVKVENLISFNVVSICEKETFKEYVENLECKLSYLRNRVVLNDRERVKKMLDALNILAKDKYVKYITIDEAATMLDSGSGIIYFGFSACPWSRNAVPVLLKAMQSSELDTIYYVNIRPEDKIDNDIRDFYILNSKFPLSLSGNLECDYETISGFIG